MDAVSLSRRFLAGLLPLFALTGCAEVRAPQSLVATGMRAPAIAISDQVVWPYRIERLEVSVDGMPAASLVSQAEASPTQNLPLIAGQHTVSLAAVVSVDGSDCKLKIDMSRPFTTVAGSHPAIRIDLTADGAASSFEVRAQAKWMVTDATFDDFGPGGWFAGPGPSPDVQAKQICRDTPDYVELVKASDLSPSPGLSVRGQ